MLAHTSSLLHSAGTASPATAGNSLSALFNAPAQRAAPATDFARTLDQRLFDRSSTPEPSSAAASSTAASRSMNSPEASKPARNSTGQASTSAATKQAERSNNTASSEDPQQTDSSAAPAGDNSASSEEVPAEQSSTENPGARPGHDTGNETPDNDQAASLAGLPAALAAAASAAGKTSPATADEDSVDTDLPLDGEAPATGKGKTSDRNSAKGTMLAAQNSGGNATSTASGSGLTPAASTQAAFGLAAAAGNTAASAALAGDKLLDPAAQAKPEASSQGSPFGLPTALRHAPSPQAQPQLPIASPPGKAAWTEEVGNQVRWMLGRAESRAELVLTPASLGKLEVSISLSGDQATAQFVASTQAARDALEQAMPKLREILEQAGLALGQADVSTSEDRSAQDQQQGAGRGPVNAGESMDDGADEAAPIHASSPIHDGLINTFA
ncbi:MAG: flagellar hook-length control protein FliK [Thauera sp.]|jgi:flagellar hook-length control protein FliK|nr:flagellar hook-length control protein FliK [Thauera sp.]